MTPHPALAPRPPRPTQACRRCLCHVVPQQPVRSSPVPAPHRPRPPRPRPQVPVCPRACCRHPRFQYPPLPSIEPSRCRPRRPLRSPWIMKRMIKNVGRPPRTRALTALAFQAVRRRRAGTAALMVAMNTEHSGLQVALVAGATGDRRSRSSWPGPACTSTPPGGAAAAARRSEIGRPETIEDTGELLAPPAGGARPGRQPRGPRGRSRPGRPDRGRAGPPWTSWSTTSSAATATRSGIGRCGSTTSRVGCGCCAWAWTPT